MFQRDPKWLAKKNGCQMAPGVDIFSQLSPILRSAGTSVYSSGQVFVQAGSGVDFFVSNFFKGQFGVSECCKIRALGVFPVPFYSVKWGP